MSSRDSNKTKHLIPSFFYRLHRRRRFKSKKKKNQKGDSYLWLRFSKPIRLLIITVLVGGFIYAFFFSTIKAFWGFSLNNHPSVEYSSKPMWYGNSRMTVLFVGVDEVDSSHIFVDSLILLIYDPDLDNLGIFNINPDLSSYSTTLNTSISLRTVLNKPQASGKEMSILIESVENLVALKVNRYMVVEKDGFNEIIANLQTVRVDLEEDIYDEDLYVDGEVLGWDSGKQNIFPSEILSFLSADEYGRDAQLRRQLQVYSSLIANIDSVGTFIKTPQLLTSIANNTYSDFGKVEFAIFAWKLRALRQDQIKLAYSRTRSALPQKKFGVYDSYLPIYDSIDNDLSTILLNTNLLKEQAKIEVLNGSSVRGLAQIRSRWITNSGGRVIHFGNNPKSETTTKIYVEEPDKFPDTLKELEKIFNGKIEYPEQEYKYKHVGDIVIVIGEDYK